eukprot:gene9479-19688_t
MSRVEIDCTQRKHQGNTCQPKATTYIHCKSFVPSDFILEKFVVTLFLRRYLAECRMDVILKVKKNFEMTTSVLINNRHLVMDYYSCLAMVFVPLCILLGFFSGQNLYQKLPSTAPMPLVVSSMNSLEYKYFLIVEMTIASMLLLDVAIDNLSNAFKNIFSTKGSLINISLLISMLLPCAVIFFISIPNHDYILMNIILGTRILFINCTILCYAYRYGNHIWKSRLTFLTGLISCVAPLLRVVALTVSFESKDLANQLETASLNLRIIVSVTLWIYNSVYNAPTVINFSSSFLISVEALFTSFVVLQAMHQTRVVRKEFNRYK